MKKAKKSVFSIVKAVKANARARIGAVPAGKAIPDPKQKAAARPRHKQSLEALLESSKAETSEDRAR